MFVNIHNFTDVSLYMDVWVYTAESDIVFNAADVIGLTTGEVFHVRGSGRQTGLVSEVHCVFVCVCERLT